MEVAPSHQSADEIADLCIAAVDAFDVGVVVLDSEARVVLWNTWMERTSKVSVNDAAGRRLDAIFPELRGTRVLLAVERALNSGMSAILSQSLNKTPFPLYSRAIGRQGCELLDQSILVRPIRAGGGARNCLVQITDVSRSVRREKLLTEHARGLESSNTLLEEFAYIISHDLKAPLRHIGSLCEWLTDDETDRLSESGQGYLSGIRERVVKMADLLDGVLAYSRAGRGGDTHEDSDIEELVQAVIDLVGLAEHADIVVETGGAIALCDRMRTSQLLQNLLDNAVKYSDKERPQIHVGCRDAGEFWQISVADNGPGIEERFQEQVFRIFHRINPKDEREGSGVGLAIAKKIVDLHGGRIWIESTPGNGTTFHFTLPKSGGATEKKEVES